MTTTATVEGGDALVQLLSRSAPRLLLLDVGGVLFPDPWETLVGDEVIGLARQLDAPQLYEAARELWSTFSLRQSTEGEFWAALSAAGGIEISASLIDDVSRRLLVPFRWASDVLDIMPATDTVIVSDNTSFWYERQSALLGIEERTGQQYLSFRTGVSKGSHPGLLEMVLEDHGTEGVLFVDDREVNVDRATGLGIESILFDPLRASHGGDDR